MVFCTSNYTTTKPFVRGLSLHHQHRAWGMTYDLLCNTPHQQLLEALSAMTSHEYYIGLLFFGNLYYPLMGFSSNKTLAAQILGIDRVSLWRKLKRYGIGGE